MPSDRFCEYALVGLAIFNAVLFAVYGWSGNALTAVVALGGAAMFAIRGANHAE
jgi:hypothetical protein